MSSITEFKLGIKKLRVSKMCVVSNLMRSEKMSSKMIALCLVLGLAASITACVGSKNTESSEDGTPLTEETVDTEAADTGAGSETGDIPEESADTEEISETEESSQDIPEETSDTEETAN